ncbi:MAG: GAF domain-containing SpoIIE family protein phosphatase [Acidimicrobiales bacterium]
MRLGTGGTAELVAAWPPGHELTERHLEALRVAADRIGAAHEQVAILESERAAKERADELAQLMGQLQRVTADLSGDLDEEGIGKKVAEAMNFGYANQVVSSTLWLRQQDELRLFQPSLAPSTALPYARVGLHSPLPGAQALRENAPVWLASRSEAITNFPMLASSPPMASRLAVVPLRASSEPFGVLAFGFKLESEFSDPERDFLLAVADQVAQSLERARLRHMERLEAERTAFLADVSATLATTLDLAETLQHIVRLIVPHFADLATIHLCSDGGMLSRVALAHRYPEVENAILGASPAGEHEEILALLAEVAERRQVFSTGPLADSPVATLLPANASEALAPLALGCALFVPLVSRERVLGVLSAARMQGATVFDERATALISDVGNRAATAIANSGLHSSLRATQRVEAFLLTVATALAGASSYAETLTELARSAVPILADFCIIDLLDEAGRFLAPVVYHSERNLSPAADRLRRILTNPDVHRPASEVIKTRQSRLVTELGQEQLDALSHDKSHLQILNELGWRSHMVVPLVAGGSVLGCLTLVAADARPSPEAADLHLAERLAEQVAEVVAQARRHEREHDISLALRHSLVPEELPQVPGFSLVARYVPGAYGFGVGGDFYGVVKLDSGDIIATVGEVVGDDQRAMTIMGRLSGGIRTLSCTLGRPAAVVAALQSQWDVVGYERPASALLVRLSPATGDFSAATAGHAPPLLVRGHDPDVVVVPMPITPSLGSPTGSAPIAKATEGHLDPGDMLVLHTGAWMNRTIAGGGSVTRKELRAWASEGPDMFCERVVGRLSATTADGFALLVLSRHW